LTRRFLALLGEVEKPEQIVAITFTKAAAAEMRHRILFELENESAPAGPASADRLSMAALARRAFVRSESLGWQLLELPARLRISTIDSLCQELAVQQPLFSGFGGSLRVAEWPDELYHRAARRALDLADENRSELQSAIESLLLWRDNDWLEVEKLLVEMLRKRDSWMHAFVLESEPDWDDLRRRLETPFVEAIRVAILGLDGLLDQVQLPDVRGEAFALMRYAHQNEESVHGDLARLARFPSASAPYANPEDLEDALVAYRSLAELMLTKGKARTFRNQFDKRQGFPQGSDREKGRATALINHCRAVEGLQGALAQAGGLPSARFSAEEWQIVRACFVLLRKVAAELRVEFAEAGTVDFTEVAQIAQRVLTGEDGLPSDAAIAYADGIHHLLVDEFQDTSRRQHRLVASLVGAWPGTEGRSVFVVGDPLQSIYSFRDADAELFSRVRDIGLELPGGEKLRLDPVLLQANFRTQPALVGEVNDMFARMFARPDGSGITFSAAIPARQGIVDLFPRLNLHTRFSPQISSGDSLSAESRAKKVATRLARQVALSAQTREIVELIGNYSRDIEAARAAGGKFRIAVLGRTRRALEPIAAALRKAAIRFRAIELEPLCDMPEVLDALALGRAFLNPLDRVAWLGILRAPWCGLSLRELHLVAGTEDGAAATQGPVAQKIAERLDLLSSESRAAVARLLDLAASGPSLASFTPTRTVGTWLEEMWLRAGGPLCVGPGGQANLNRLWRCLDQLPKGGEDFVGPALDRALEALKAMPDPSADPDLGVQLMTIHRSKGLEFEVVIVPELQALTPAMRGGLLSWMERDPPVEDRSGSPAEFLIAPLQTKGAERSQARLWVDRLMRDREQQEMRRILYVAATRAREDLHLFARPGYRESPAGPHLNTPPGNCLLATAWPAIETTVRAYFEDQRPALRAVSTRGLEGRNGARPAALSDADNPLEIHRLPPDIQIRSRQIAGKASPDANPGEPGGAEIFARHEGGIASRTLGSAVHALLEELARLYQTSLPDEAARALGHFLPRITSRIRAAGLAPAAAQSVADHALRIARKAASDPAGRWILSPHGAAASEASWSGVVSEAVRSVRVDRVFRAGLEPFVDGDQALWIIDYKTAQDERLGPGKPASDLRTLFAQQLEAYASILRQSIDKRLPIHAGLYYPRLEFFDWWKVEA
jgi:ATP-dependent exoDNAse (exonuclease V) beta subunit